MTTTPHSEFEDALAAFALGALDAAEKRALEAHVATCVTCQVELKKMRRVVTGIGLAVEPVAPPDGLKDRVLAHAMAQPQLARPGAELRPRQPEPRVGTPGDAQTRVAWLAVAASLALAAAASIYAWSLRSQVVALRQTVTVATAQADSLRTELVAARREAASLIRAVRVLSAPDLIEVNLKGQETAPNAVARGFWSKNEGLLFTAGGLPQVDVTRVYQLWLINGSQVTSGGTFKVDSNGNATMDVASNIAAEPPEAIAVSVERAGGVPVREGPVVLLGSTKQS